MSAALRILLVEDSATQALKLRGVFEAKGWETVWVDSAPAALEELARAAPDLVIVDYYLPGMRGDELCRRIRTNVGTRDVLTLMLTVEEDEATQLRGLESGADDYVSKAVEDEVLLLRVHALLKKARARSTVLGLGEGPFRQARLLAIDDSPTYLAFLVSELLAEGYEVRSAGSGEEGLSLLQSEPFDCVLVDLVMPGLDGIGVCREIGKLRRKLESPIVVLILTAHESKEEMTRGLEAGADDFVGKSSDLAVLKARIRALLRRKFFQEENERILQELRQRELETVRARTEKEAAEARAALAEELHRAHEDLQVAYRKLKETEVQLVHSEKMASLGQLVAGIAHEINNPLAFAINNLFVISERIEEVASGEAARLSAPGTAALEKVRARLPDTNEGLRRVQELVVKLRTFSRLDEGDFKVVDVHEGIESVLLFLNHRLGERIAVERRFAPSGRLGCYPGQLNQAVMNVLANAIDAIAGKGTITIETRREEPWFAVSVTDTGPGMPADVKRRMFEPFFTTKPVGRGTGLGLAITDTIVRAHQGEIDVESDPARGTRLTIRIPLDLERKVSHGTRGAR